MKRVLLCAILATALAAGFVSAQESSGEPSAESVLQAARDKYNGTDNTQAETLAPPVSEPVADYQAPPGADGSTANQDNYPYTPAVIGFVPWISFPMGVYDSTLAASAVGAMNGTIVGLQAAGVFSVALESVFGAQVSGVLNLTNNNLRGLQAAGVFNVVGGNVDGIQTAGVFNIVGGSADWIQAAGVFNLVGGTMNGLQAAGVMNVSGNFSGVMASGVINVTGSGKGVMVGVVNVADSLDGVAIGLVNIIKDGIWDINTDYQFDSKTAYLTYRSGTPALYAVAYAGQTVADLLATSNNISAGAGIGHRFKVLFLTVDSELCFESSPIEAFSELRNHEECSGFTEASLRQIAGFGSLRVSFGFGQRKGFGVYMGLKTDFGNWGSFTVPERFRYSFGTAQPEGTMLFDKIRPFWPKWFIGIRY